MCQKGLRKMLQTAFGDVLPGLLSNNIFQVSIPNAGYEECAVSRKNMSIEFRQTGKGLIMFRNSYEVSSRKPTFLPNMSRKGIQPIITM